MPFTFLTTILLIVSILTNLTVEGIKKLLDGTSVKYSSNILAVICSVVLSLIVSICYIILNKLTFTVDIGIEIIILMYLGFLVSTVGYDKVIQMIEQLRITKGG